MIRQTQRLKNNNRYSNKETDKTTNKENCTVQDLQGVKLKIFREEDDFCDCCESVLIPFLGNYLVAKIIYFS